MNSRLKKYKEKTRGMITDVAWNFAAKIIAMICGFAVDILIARILGVDNYAEWGFFYTIATIMFYLTWFGISASAKVYVSKQTSILDRNTCISAGLVLRMIVSLIFMVLIFCSSNLFASMLGYPNKYPNLLKLFKCASFLIFFNSYAEFFKEVNRGMQKYKNVFFITFFEFGCNFLFGSIGAYIFGNVMGIAYGYIVSGGIVYFLGFYLLGKSEFCNEFRNNKFPAFLKKISSYAIPLAIISIGGMILMEMDTFMLGVISTKQDVANYSIAKQLCSKAVHVNNALATGTLTSFSLIDSKNLKEQKDRLKKVNGLNIFISCFVSLFFIVAGAFTIQVLYGSEYEYAGNIIRWLVPYYFLYSISSFLSLFLDFQGKAGLRSICYCSVLAINMLLNWFLIPKFGAIGASVASGISLMPYTLTVIILTVRCFNSD